MPGSQSKFYFYVNVTFENTRAYGCVNNNFDITRNLRCCGFVMEMMVAPTSTISLSFPWLPRHGPVTFLRVRKCAGLSIQRDCSGLTYPHHNNFGLCLPSRPNFGKKKKKALNLPYMSLCRLIGRTNRQHIRFITAIRQYNRQS